MKFRKNLLTAAIVGLLAFGGAACADDAGNGGETDVNGGGEPTIAPTAPLAPATE